MLQVKFAEATDRTLFCDNLRFLSAVAKS